MSWKDELDETSPAYKLASSDAKIIRAVAGPGSGKSFAIKKRILRLLEEGITPEEILAVTFTRTAAQDLKKEIGSLGGGADKVQIRTLHSHAMKILMKADVLQITGRTPRIVLSHEIKPALKDLVLSSDYSLKELTALHDSFLAGWATLQSLDAGHATNAAEAEFEVAIIDWLKEHKGLLVGEVIPVATNFLRNNPAHPERSMFKVLLIDEYQDLNKCEQEFVKLISGDADVVIVGDDDQSIYGFKFAHPEGIQEVDKLYGNYEDITFDECRRCPQQVTRMASELINKNTNRTLGVLNPHHNNPEGIVEIVQWSTYDDELNGIVKIIELELANGILNPSDILILTPRRRNGYLLEQSLRNLGVPAKSYFREDAISSEKVKHAYSLLNLIANPTDLISLRFLLGSGSTDYREKQYKKLHELAQTNSIDVFEVLKRLSDGSLTSSRTTQIVGQYKELIIEIEKVKKQIAEDPKELFANCFINNEDEAFDFSQLLQVYNKAVETIGTDDYSKPDKFNDWFSKVFNQIQESISTPEVPNDLDHLRIMSLHASKGLGAKLVIVCSMINGIMPKVDNTLSQEQQKLSIEEQRRLFYVAITRCKSSNDYQGRLIISSFLQINRNTALNIGYGLASQTNHVFNAVTTNFVTDFGTTGTIPIPGTNLIN